MENKRGLSDIVITLIMVVLALGAIALVWVVVSGLMQGGTEDIELSSKCLHLNLDITAAVCKNGTSNKTCNFTIVRTGNEEGELGGIKVVLLDKVNGESSPLIDKSGNIEKIVQNKVSISEAESKMSNSSRIDSILITPYFKDELGEEHLCSIPKEFLL
jgi:hypothetical protein